MTAGGGVELAIGQVSLRARAERRDDLVYAARRAWLAIVAPL